MPLLLTPEQEQRIHAVVRAGAYSSIQDALDAAVFAMETAAAAGFDGASAELKGLLEEGLASPELSEDRFWSAVDDRTNGMIAAHKPEPRA